MPSNAIQPSPALCTCTDTSLCANCREQAEDAWLSERRQARPRFSLGRLVATPGALRALAASPQDGPAFLARHVSGDWGDVDAHDHQANDAALRDGDRLLSAYTTSAGVRLWVITEADRSATTLLLPDEY